LLALSLVPVETNQQNHPLLKRETIMERKKLIDRLVKKNLASALAKGCVPCLGKASRNDKKNADAKK